MWLRTCSSWNLLVDTRKQFFLTVTVTHRLEASLTQPVEEIESGQVDLVYCIRRGFKDFIKAGDDSSDNN